MTIPTPGSALDAIAADCWQVCLEVDPQYATALGEPGFDGRLADQTPEGQRAARERFAGILATLDPAQLLPEASQ